jgi:hypothetical protein
LPAHSCATLPASVYFVSEIGKKQEIRNKIHLLIDSVGNLEEPIIAGNWAAE